MKFTRDRGASMGMLGTDLQSWQILCPVEVGCWGFSGCSRHWVSLVRARAVQKKNNACWVWMWRGSRIMIDHKCDPHPEGRNTQ
jgi:hypothetical protein